MNEVIKLLKAIALSENPNAWGVIYSKGAFWVYDDTGREGLFCNEALDKCFSDALSIQGGWYRYLPLVEEGTTSAMSGDVLNGEKEARLFHPTWSIVYLDDKGEIK